MKSKLLHSLREALEAAGLQDGMTVSFHHHLRNGDYILNLVLEEAARMGIRNLTVNASSMSPVASAGIFPPGFFQSRWNFALTERGQRTSPQAVLPSMSLL